MIGGRSLVDEVNHVKMVVSFFVLLCACLISYFIYMKMLVWMKYKGLLVEQITNHVILQTH